MNVHLLRRSKEKSSYFERDSSFPSPLSFLPRSNYTFQIVVTRKFFRQNLRATSVPPVYTYPYQRSIARCKETIPTNSIALITLPIPAFLCTSLPPPNPNSNLESVPSRLQAGACCVPYIFAGDVSYLGELYRFAAVNNA